MTNWKTLFSNDDTKNVVSRFANGDLSGRQVSNILKNTEFAGPFRTLIRTNGVAKARTLSRRALQRAS